MKPVSLYNQPKTRAGLFAKVLAGPERALRLGPGASVAGVARQHGGIRLGVS